MKLSRLFALSILLWISVASFSVISPAKAAPWLRISNAQLSGYSISDEHAVVYGEIKNQGDQAATDITFFVDFRDQWAEGGGTGSSLEILLVELNSPIVIAPGEAWPWEIHWLDPDAVDFNQWNYIEPITYNVVDALPVGLEIVSHSSASPGVVVGEVQNIGTAPTTNIEVGATFKDAGGVVVATAFAEISGPLSPGATEAFSISLNQTDLSPIIDDVLPLIASYTVTAQSEEYGIIPEFHIWTSMLLILVVLTVAIALCKRRPLTTQNP